MWWDYRAAFGLPELHSVPGHSQLQGSWKHNIWNQSYICGRLEKKTVLLVTTFKFTYITAFLLVSILFVLSFDLTPSVENLQYHLLPSGNMVPVCFCGADLHGDCKNLHLLLKALKKCQHPKFNLIILEENKTVNRTQNDRFNLYYYVSVLICAFTEKILHEGLGHGAEVDVYPAPLVAALQWWDFSWWEWEIFTTYLFNHFLKAVQTQNDQCFAGFIFCNKNEVISEYLL